MDTIRNTDRYPTEGMRMIPDIGFMIVIYGVARLLVAALDPYRRGTGTGAQIATVSTWVIAIAGTIGLVALGAAVANSSAALPNLGG